MKSAGVLVTAGCAANNVEAIEINRPKPVSVFIRLGCKEWTVRHPCKIHLVAAQVLAKRSALFTERDFDKLQAVGRPIEAG